MDEATIGPPQVVTRHPSTPPQHPVVCPGPASARGAAAGGRAAVESGRRPRQEIQRTTFTDRLGTEPRVEKGPRATTEPDTTRLHQQNDAGASVHRARGTTTSAPSTTAAPASRDHPNGPVRQASIPTPPLLPGPVAATEQQRAAHPPTPTCRPPPVDAPDPPSRTTDALPLPHATPNDLHPPIDANEPDDPSPHGVPHRDATLIEDARLLQTADAGITGKRVVLAREKSGILTSAHLEDLPALLPRAPEGHHRLSLDGVRRQRSRPKETTVLVYHRAVARPVRPHLCPQQDINIVQSLVPPAALIGLLDQACPFRGEAHGSVDGAEGTSQILQGR